MAKTYKILDKLPNPLIFDDGSRVTTKEDWERRKEEFTKRIVDLEFGGMPPEPEFFEMEPLQMFYPGRKGKYRIFTGTKTNQMSFTMTVYRPTVEGRQPVLLYGDGCFSYLNDAVVAELLKRGYAIAVFDRNEFAPDIKTEERNSGLYKIYPDMQFRAISAWAWGYMRAVDALMNIEFVDPNEIAITGHSRGGKTVLLAGALDKRIKYINPNDSGAHGCGCYRYEEYDSESVYEHNEFLGDLFTTFFFWMGQDMRQYIGKEAEIPHDMHYFKALCAPRYLLETNAYDDIWSNPRGSYQTFLAAQKVYEFLGCKDNIASKYREGGHFHRFEDFVSFLDFIEFKRTGKELPEDFTRNPYPDMELMGIKDEK